ncbi:GGDEF domain-containing response regulator, partial [Methylogaea oryzae]
MNILLADDSRATATPTIHFLTTQGYRVTHVLNGQEALAAYQADRPDLVLMDVVMPIMDGIEATRRIKGLGGARWVPLMLMTGLSQQDEIVAGLDAGADDYLIKPISFQVLSARMRSMHRIATMQDSLFGILDNVYEAIVTIDEAGIVQSYNTAGERIFGYSAAEVVGRNVKLLMPPPYAEEHDGYLARYLRERTPHVIGTGRTVRGRRKNGDVFPMRLAITEIRRADASLFIGLLRDVSEEEAARKRIEFLALHDPLTRLANRAYFNETLAGLSAKPGDDPHALIFIDLDGFKPINDRLGHEAGDEVLKVVAGRLSHALARCDFVARLGGDEFVAIAKNVGSAQNAKRVAQRLLEVLSVPMTLQGATCRVGASIGVALLGRGMDTGMALNAADSAMYAAKRDGKGRVALAG